MKKSFWCISGAGQSDKNGMSGIIGRALGLFYGLFKNARQMREKKLAATERKTNNKSVKTEIYFSWHSPFKEVSGLTAEVIRNFVSHLSQTI